MPEKRVYDRQRKRIKIRFGVDSPAITAFARDLSASGVQVHTNRVLTPGTTLQVELHFPEQTFTMWARVAWAKRVPPQLAHTLQCGMGLEFLEPDPAWVEFVQSSKPGGGRRG